MPCWRQGFGRVSVGLQLTRGGEYGIRAMAYLAGRAPGEVCSLHEVGGEQSIPESFLAKIFQNLARAGLVISRRGARGGFVLARPAEDISIADVLEAIDGPVALNICVLQPEACENCSRCGVHHVWVHAQERMMEVLREASLADVARAIGDARPAADRR